MKQKPREIIVTCDEWSACIERTGQGFTVTTITTDNGEVVEQAQEVFEDSPKHKAQSFIDVVNYLFDHFGVIGSKHDDLRIWCGLLNRGGNPTYLDDE